VCTCSLHIVSGLVREGVHNILLALVANQPPVLDAVAQLEVRSILPNMLQLLRRPNADSPAAATSPYFLLPPLLELGAPALSLPKANLPPTTVMSDLGFRVVAMHSGQATENITAFAQVQRAPSLLHSSICVEFRFSRTLHFSCFLVVVIFIRRL
jgi:hypothetical protein